MRRNGAQLAVYALEQIGVKHTFGIPGTHTTELYDALEDSSIHPVLVTHEGGGAFMADAVSRTSDSIGCLVIVPAAGLTHAMSGIGEAYLDGIPMLIISGGTRTDSGKQYQLHQFDQLELCRSITKARFRVSTHAEIISTIYEAYGVAVAGEPGPVFVEIPVNLLLFTESFTSLPSFKNHPAPPIPDDQLVQQALNMIHAAEAPMLYVGWGAREAQDLLIELAELIGSPVATTLQGKSSFPNSHALYTSVGLGESAKPSCQWALKRHDVLIAIGVRFSEIATGSYGLDPPKNLIHIDINPEVFNANFAATLAIEADARAAVAAILNGLKKDPRALAPDVVKISRTIRSKNESYLAGWHKTKLLDKVSPGYFFTKLKKQLDPDVRLVVDDGKHTFLASELFPVDRPGHFISPTDFNCMGYAVPAAIGVQLANPTQQVATIVGDGAFLMTCMEITTAVDHNLPILYFVFNDGELGQISQFQKIPLNRKTCSVLGGIDYAGIAQATGAGYVKNQ